jgi:hypothetical protein
VLAFARSVEVVEAQAYDSENQRIEHRIFSHDEEEFATAFDVSSVCTSTLGFDTSDCRYCAPTVEFERSDREYRGY